MTEIQTAANACELHEADLSAVLDGELETVDLLRALDHLVDCSRCAEFYRRSRDLDLAVAASRAAGESAGDSAGREDEAIEPSDKLWEQIAENAPWAGSSERQPRPATVAEVAQLTPVRRRGSRIMEWAPRLAAAFVVGFGLWIVFAVTRDAGSAEFFRQASEASVEASVDVLSEDDLSESTIETGDPLGTAEMSEERFVQLATEVLRAEPRFQYEMLRVMKSATRGASREATADVEQAGDEIDRGGARDEGEGASGGRLLR